MVVVKRQVPLPSRRLKRLLFGPPLQWALQLGERTAGGLGSGGRYGRRWRRRRWRTASTCAPPAACSSPRPSAWLSTWRRPIRLSATKVSRRPFFLTVDLRFLKLAQSFKKGSFAVNCRMCPWCGPALWQQVQNELCGRTPDKDQPYDNSFRMNCVAEPLIRTSPVTSGSRVTPHNNGSRWIVGLYPWWRPVVLPVKRTPVNKSCFG